MNKLLAVLSVLALLLSSGAIYLVATQHPVETGGKGGTSNADAISLTGSLTIGADNNGNGVTDTASRKTLTAATTTPCAILSPAATSTIVSTAFNATVSTSSLGFFTLATSTTPYATTSLVSTMTLAANAEGTLNWDGGANNALIAPNTYLVYGVQGVAYGYTYGGTCNAVFRSVN